MIVEKVSNDKYELRILVDEHPENPRDWDNLGKMICFHRRYSIGDSHNYNSDDYSGWSEMEAAITRKEDAAVILPVYMYDHSGISLKTTPFSCPWDSGQVGFIAASREDIRNCFGIKNVTKKYRDKAEEILKSEVERMNNYAAGNVYGFQLIEQDSKEIIEEGYGFYGDLMDVSEELKLYIEEEYKDLINKL